MSDTAATIIKIMSTLVSPRVCVKYIAVAISIVLSYIYVGRYLESLEVQLSQVHSDAVVILIGLGFGGIIGYVVVSIFDLLKKHWLLHVEHQQRVAEAAALERSQLKEQDEFLQLFESAIFHLKRSQVRTLRLLSKGIKNIDFSENENEALEKNGYIKKISCSYGKVYLTRLNPAIEKHVLDHWKYDVNLRIEKMHEENRYSEQLLNILCPDNRDDNFFVNEEILADLKEHGGYCLHGAFYSPERDQDPTEYHVWFGEYDDDVIEELEKRHSRKYDGSLIIPISQLQRSEP
ncbi:MAG: hypothetical protein LAT65_10820 [Saccharospirillum sp.]|nr:hypothetical protein [Saccharospirillum sp.]